MIYENTLYVEHMIHVIALFQLFYSSRWWTPAAILINNLEVVDRAIVLLEVFL